MVEKAFARWLPNKSEIPQFSGSNKPSFPSLR